MPKMKTKRAAAKRYSLTATGKVKVKRAFLQHILEKRGKGNKRRAQKPGYVHASDMKNVKKCIPYGA